MFPFPNHKVEVQHSRYLQKDLIKQFINKIFKPIFYCRSLEIEPKFSPDTEYQPKNSNTIRRRLLVKASSWEVEPHRKMVVTLRTRARSLRPRSASLRAKGRMSRRRSGALGTSVIARRPGPEEPRACIAAAEMDSSRASSAGEGGGWEGAAEDRRRRSEKRSSKGSRISAATSAVAVASIVIGVRRRGLAAVPSRPHEQADSMWVCAILSSRDWNDNGYRICRPESD